MATAENFDWMKEMTTEELTKAEELAEQCAIRGGRLGMGDAYNYHLRRAREFRREIERRQTLEEGRLLGHFLRFDPQGRITVEEFRVR